MFERIIHILIKEFLQLFRNPRMRVIVFVPPVIQILIFGYAANTDVRHIATAVYDLDNSPASRQLVRDFSYSKYFDIKGYISSEDLQRQLIDKSDVSVVIRINRGFEKDLNANRTAQFQLIIDGTDSSTASIIGGYANTIAEKYSLGLLHGRAASRLVSMPGTDLSESERSAEVFASVDLRTRAWFNENLESRNYYIPGVIALIVTLITLLLTSMAVVREKELGTIEQLIVSPLRPVELILGKLLPFAIIGLADALLVTLVGVLWFDVPVRGNLLLLLACAILFLLTTLGIGLFISTLSGTQQEAMMSGFFFFFPAVLLSGFIFPIANMPVIVQYITLLNPLRYFLVILRGIFLKGVGVEILWPQMLALFIMGLAVLTVSSLRFRKRLG
jgi:ABC-2 type transport system permease protein